MSPDLHFLLALTQETIAGIYATASCERKAEQADLADAPQVCQWFC